MKVVNVVLSGGVGSRLWPLSRKSKPKQYLPLFDGRSLFELSIERNITYCDEICIVGGIDNYQLSREIMQKMKVKRYTELVEACPRNTAAAIAFAAFAADPDDVLLITPSDHLIQVDEDYRDAVLQAIQMASDGHIVTFGLKPKHAETGFGYIEHDGNEVISFREKPSEDLAQIFLESGKFLWNSGMFCFKASVFLEELEKYEPVVYEKSKRVFFKRNGIYMNDLMSREIPSISVDYAVMERTEKIKVIPSYFSWSDMGSFQAIFDAAPADDQRKINTNMVLNSSKLVEFVGVENVILVETDDAILVLHKEKAQDVKKVYERLELENPKYLR
ncbi:mannose-1-phosphate guanylyltransferase [Belliella kenyensis]|uniref:Mannose-1-phosphate guanylyltransferase n=1 Tax=Belliella kenyensis TaxID=1472724 RepID=A0ABV8EM16_9BACT|nr:sugar phosphate nucleotidyltransferase [Belliella kenyensis]MCH7403666.1 NTP transferase domain-containing protein [Belliella kenyensis]MDN3602180.1 sugar phosphate nucleotidyltransferase [Belliella kenyensis]